MTVETGNGQHVFMVHVYFDDLDPDAVRVELYANGVVAESSGAPGNEAIARAGRGGKRLCISRMRACGPSRERTIPSGSYLAMMAPRIPLEAAQILWQR